MRIPKSLFRAALSAPSTIVSGARLLTCCGALMLLVGCTAGPDYKRPTVPLPLAFKEVGDWKIAEPGAIDSEPWWTQFKDAELNALITQLESANLDISASEARYRSASAVLKKSRAARAPTLRVAANATRASAHNGVVAEGDPTLWVSPAAPPHTARTATLDAQWEIDLWSHVRRQVESNQAQLEASSANLAAIRLSQKTTLAQLYVQLRALDLEDHLQARLIQTYQQRLRFQRQRRNAGLSQYADLLEAQQALQQAQRNLRSLQRTRTEHEHAIAELLGKLPSEFSLAAKPLLPPLLHVPFTLPSELLERRPDIAEAERKMAAANAEIGVRATAYFPRMTLNATVAYNASAAASWLSAANRAWSAGPALALTLWDGGARQAEVDAAQAHYEAQVAQYRKQILTAFKETEDQLLALRLLAEEAALQDASAQNIEQNLVIETHRYQAGLVDYLALVPQQIARLHAKIEQVTLRKKRLIATLSLIKALGGDWLDRRAKHQAQSLEPV